MESLLFHAVVYQNVGVPVARRSVTACHSQIEFALLDFDAFAFGVTRLREAFGGQSVHIGYSRYLGAWYDDSAVVVEHGDIDIRYIAINDGVDSDKGDNDFTPFRNLFNDFYARDTSKKIRAVMRSKGNAGEHLCTNPPYGYRKDPTDKKKWIVDEEAAAVVKRIFDLCIAGKGPMQIAKALTADKVLTVKAYYAKRDGKSMPDNLYR